MATSVAPEGREAAADPGAAAREASAAPAPVVVPTDRPAQQPDESGDAFKQRYMADAKARALQIAKDSGMPGVGAPELSEAEKTAALAAIDKQHTDPMGAAADAAAAVDPAAVVDPAVVVDPATVVDPAAAPVVDPAATVGIPVEIAIPGQESPFVLEVGDQDTADIITDLQRRASRGDQARAIRADATRLRDEADEFRHVVELDPAGVLQESVTDARDQAHLAKYLLTRPGILANPEIREFIEAALEDTPERAKERGELMELERLKRRDAVRDSVNAKREGRNEERAIGTTTIESIESLVPDSFSREGRELLYNLTRGTVDALRQQSPGRAFDRRTIPGIIQHHLKTLGIAPRGPAAAAPVAPAPAARPSAPAAAAPKAAAPAILPTAKTAEQLRAAARARQDAATAGPGQGSEVSRVPAAPAYDPAQPGDAVSQRIAWARKTLVPSMSRRPVGS